MRILYHGDSPTVDTGFGRVAKEILTRLHKKGYEIEALGINHYGTPYDRNEIPFEVWPVDKGGVDEIFGYAKLWWIAKQFKPDLLLMLNDPWIIDKAISAKPGQTPYLKTIVYFPVDAGPLKSKWAQVLSELDAQVCYSNFAEKIVIDANKGKRPSNLHQIYHGVNTEVFRPLDSQLCRKRLGIPVDDFIVGMVARNQYRKRFDILAKAFAEFSKDKPEAKLYLHTAEKDIGYDIKDLSEQTNLAGKLILTADVTPAEGVPDEMLNEIYNTFDVNCLISLGDGFGLPVAESMATGCPQLVSDHSCLKELVDGHGGLTVKNAAWLMHTQGINTWGGLSDVDDLVEKLNTLYNSKPLRNKLAEDGYNFIHQDKFQWDYITDQFDDIIKQIFHFI